MASNPGAGLPMDRLAIRNRTIFYISFPVTLVFAALTWQAVLYHDIWVIAGNVLGILITIAMGYLASRQRPPNWLPYPFLVYLYCFLYYLVITGYQGGVATAWILVVPPLVLLMLGTRVGVIWLAILLPALAYAFFLRDSVSDDVISYPYRVRLGIVALITAGFCLAYSASIDWYDRTLHQVEERIDDLERMLSICSHCKQVRIDDDWRQVEDYISKLQDLRISHGICPDCMSEHYGHIETAEIE